VAVGCGWGWRPEVAEEAAADVTARLVRQGKMVEV